MKRPWQVWTLFAVALLVMGGAMGWLTQQALELDRAERLARLEREREAAAGSALWRMDAYLTPFLAEEAVRPHWLYQPTIFVADAGKPRRVLSPLARAPQFVRLHFTLDSEGQLTSPQSPTGGHHRFAIEAGITSAELAEAEQRLAELYPAITTASLVDKLPDESLSGQILPEGAEPVATDPALQLSNTIVAPNYSQVRAQPQSQQSGGDQLTTAEQNSKYFEDYKGREQALQKFATRSRDSVQPKQLDANQTEMIPQSIEGPSRPLWVGDRLIVARRTRYNGETLIQGCWLDWPALRNHLAGLAALPDVSLAPISPTDEVDPNRLLASLPVQLILPARDAPAVANSPLRWALAAAWIGLVLAGLAGGLTLYKVLSLSERRAAFVSAVTHELRTPLTTVRLYTEMLAGGMVTDEARRAEYLETLRRESDRLSHLVDNVLQYARLERGRPGGRRETLSVAELFDRIIPRLAGRVSQAGMSLEVEAGEPVRSQRLSTDPAALEQILFNLVDNASKYAPDAGDRRVHLRAELDGNRLHLVVEDHGPGVPADVRRRLFRPFSKSSEQAAVSAPGVGLGLALSRRLAADLDARLDYDAAHASGARFTLEMRSLVVPA